MEKFELFQKLINTHGSVLNLTYEAFFYYEDEDRDGNSIKFRDSSPFNEIDSDYYNNMLSTINMEIGEYLEYEDIFKGAKVVDNFGGEGEGNSYWTVFYFPKLDIYIKFDGYYASYDGASFDEYYQVLPEEKTITVYNQIVK